MPVEEESERVETTKTTTYYACDVDGCEERSNWKEDMNWVAINPKTASIGTPGGDKVNHDGVSILCDECLKEFKDASPVDFETHFTIDQISRGHWQ